MSITEPPRPCERPCAQCGEYKHYSRFRSYRANPVRNSTVSNIAFSRLCRDCEQKNRNEKKNEDRPKAIIEGRARTAAHNAGASFEFFWMQMNYRALVPVMRAYLSSEGICIGCGHKFVNERDVQIEHGAAPRHSTDWARLHARNIRLMCGSCNRTKSTKAYELWLDEQESARLSNLAPRSAIPIKSPNTETQFDLFDLGGHNRHGR